MVKLHVLTPEEAAMFVQRPGGAAVDLSEYIKVLQEMQSGQMGEAILEEGEKKRTIKRRLTIAAGKLSKELRYLKSDEGSIVYEVK